MHELPVIGRVLDIVLRHAAQHDVSKVVRIHLRIGELSDLEDEWMQHYLEYVSRDTIAEGATLVIEKAPIVLQCESCSVPFDVARDELQAAVCPSCGEAGCRLVSGREYEVKNIEVM